MMWLPKGRSSSKSNSHHHRIQPLPRPKTLALATSTSAQAVVASLRDVDAWLGADGACAWHGRVGESAAIVGGAEVAVGHATVGQPPPPPPGVDAVAWELGSDESIDQSDSDASGALFIDVGGVRRWARVYPSVRTTMRCC